MPSLGCVLHIAQVLLVLEAPPQALGQLELCAFLSMHLYSCMCDYRSEVLPILYVLSCSVCLLTCQRLCASVRHYVCMLVCICIKMPVSTCTCVPDVNPYVCQCAGW